MVRNVVEVWWGGVAGRCGGGVVGRGSKEG